MGRLIVLHAHMPGPHFQTGKLRFGREWQTHFAAQDFLEFSEYGRDRAYPRGAWFFASAGLGVLAWIAIATAFF